MNEFWQWIPGKSVGPFIFGEDIERYLTEYELRKRPDTAGDWQIYELAGFESWICVEEGIVVSVHCVDAFGYRGENLIGVRDSMACELIDDVYEVEKDVGLGYAMHYQKLGLTLFVVNTTVSAVACGLICSQ